MAALFVMARLDAAPPPKPFHLVLEANPAAAFPLLNKFGGVELHLYPAGVRAESLWLKAFSRNGSHDITVLNPIARMYSEVPVANVSSVVGTLARTRLETGTALLPVSAPTNGTVHGIPAQRYRIAYGPEAWIDLWTTQTLGDAPQYRAIVQQFIRGVSPATAATAAHVPGVPVYVELNFSHFKKVAVLKVKEFSADASGQDDALATGMLYMHAPLPDSWLH